MTNDVIPKRNVYIIVWLRLFQGIILTFLIATANQDVYVLNLYLPTIAMADADPCPLKIVIQWPQKYKLAKLEINRHANSQKPKLVDAVNLNAYDHFFFNSLKLL